MTVRDTLLARILLAKLVRCVFIVTLAAVFALPAVPIPARAAAPKPDGNLALILIRDALIAVNHANWTGNYTVLRDYASPSFAKVNDPVKLTFIFQSIRSQALDLAPVLSLIPQITKAELSDDGARLKLVGYFDSRPKVIHFDLSFESIHNRWLLFAVGVRGNDPKVAKQPDPSVIAENDNRPRGAESSSNTERSVRPAKLKRVPTPTFRPEYW